MSRRASGVPQTPIQNDDALERSIRRQQSSARGRSISDVAKRVQESPLHRGPGANSNGSASELSSRRLRGSQDNMQVAPGDFQEWMKMVRMKRVKANNAFTIQLIDAFHSMIQGEVLSSDGQNVTFQEATHTLGGCLTVYKNRIARVKDDTSKLLIGVSENKATNDDRDEDSYESDEDGEEGEDEEERQKKRKKTVAKKALGAEAFLAPAKKLEIDTNELATSIDPLLRKMSADFDKRGAGALLQYSLKLDKQGRLLLDAEAQEIDESRPEVPTRSQQQRSNSRATSVNLDSNGRLPQVVEEEEEEEEEEEGDAGDQGSSAVEKTNEKETRVATEANGILEQHASATDKDDLYLAHFNVSYFTNIDLTCREALPMVDGIARAVANPIDGTEALVKEMQAWALTDPGNDSTYRLQENENAFENAEEDGLANGDEAAADNDGHLDGLGLDIAFEGDYKDMDIDDPATDIAQGDISGHEDLSLNSIVSARLPASGNWMDIAHLQSLDSQRTNWAGPSFWKIRRLHAKEDSEAAALSQSNQAKKARSNKSMATAALVIDFSDETEVNINDVFAPSSRSTLLGKKQYDMQDKHLLPVDMHVTTKQLVGLQLRPFTGIAPAFRTGMWQSAFENDVADISVAADQSIMNSVDLGYNGDGTSRPNNDDDYFFTGWDESPNSALHRPTTASAMFSQNTQMGYGTQSNQLNFARVAKRVDVRRLKDNVWRAIQKEEEAPTTAGSENSPKEETTLIKVIQDTQPLYSEQQRSDLSPAMYFISLLHLSNEKGLSLENTETLTDIRIACGS